MIGKTLGNRYEIVEKLGGGGMALVYKAKCSLLNREVTIKVLRGEYTSDEDFVTRFRREAQAVAKLSHANIVSIYDVGNEDDIHYIVMEYVEGKNLKEYIKENAPIPQDKAINIAMQIAEALDHAHEHQIVHRDIKPHNILITPSGKVKVTDFGIARATTTATVTQTGMVLGSVHYFSPEQARGEITGPKSDIYALGVVMYEMLTGKLPFDGETPIAIALKQIQEQPVPPSEITAGINPELEKLILKAMAKNPDDRYQKAGDMWQDLYNLQMGSPTLAAKHHFTDEFATQVLSKEALGRELAKNKPEEPKKPKNKKNKSVLWLVLGVIALGLLMGAGLAAFSGLWQKEEVKVPDLTNMTIEQARLAAEEGKLKVSVAGEEFDPEIESGKIISQKPLPEAIVKEGRLIEVTISKGQEMVQVPRVKGKTKDEAELDLSNADLKVGEVTEEFSDEVSEGLIVAQFPDAYSDAVKGSEVDLIISKGPEPRFVPVPNVVGRSLDEAKNALRDAGLEVGEINEETSDQQFAGIVLTQEPQAGNDDDDDRVREGTKVNLTVSSGPGPQAKRFIINLTDSDPSKSIVPIDAKPHLVQVKVFDDSAPQGRVVHENTYIFSEPTGDTVVVELSGKGRIVVYVDGTVRLDREVK